MAKLNVHPAELLKAADAYGNLANRAADLSPQATTAVQQITDTHGPMGFPAATGIAAGIADAEKPLNAKVTDFQSYSRRLTEHAATYVDQDLTAAQHIRYLKYPDHQNVSPISVATAAFTPLKSNGDGIVIWCVPTPGGFRCTNLFSDGRYVVYPSPTDRTGGWLP